jgi:excisionase family DNA binding protein
MAKHTMPTDNQSERPALPKLAYTMEETAQVMGVSYITVHRLLKRGLLRSSTALRSKLIPRAEIERFLKATLTK